jgi:hypothetical protein
MTFGSEPRSRSTESSKQPGASVTSDGASVPSRLLTGEVRHRGVVFPVSQVASGSRSRGDSRMFASFRTNLFLPFVRRSLYLFVMARDDEP